MDYKREFLLLRGWTFVKEPVYSKTDGHGSHAEYVISDYREYAIKGRMKENVNDAWEYECGRYLFELVSKENINI